METLTDQVNVEAFKSWLTRSTTTKDLFRWDVSFSDALKMLQVAYERAVASRGMKYELPDDVYNNLKAIAGTMTTKSTKCGILLCGNCGNGKTTTMQAFESVTTYLHELYKKRCMENGSWPRMLKMQSTSARRLTQVAKDETLMAEAKKVDVLCIDDIGLEPTEVLDYGNAISPVIEIMEARYKQQLFTFVTTNLTPAQIREKYGDRIADRFNEMMKCIVYKNPTFRK